MSTKKIDLKAGQNGTSANGHTNGNTTTAVAIPTQKKETATPEKVLEELTEKRQPQPGELLSISEILQKVNRLNELSAQRAQALKTVEKLKGFNPELTEARTTVNIEDDNGNDFSTTNTEALKLIIGGFLKYSEQRLADIEKELQKNA
jgi:hypothetical protein